MLLAKAIRVVLCIAIAVILLNIQISVSKFPEMKETLMHYNRNRHSSVANGSSSSAKEAKKSNTSNAVTESIRWRKARHHEKPHDTPIVKSSAIISSTSVVSNAFIPLPLSLTATRRPRLPRAIFYFLTTEFVARIRMIPLRRKNITKTITRWIIPTTPIATTSTSTSTTTSTTTTATTPSTTTLTTTATSPTPEVNGASRRSTTADLIPFPEHGSRPNKTTTIRARFDIPESVLQTEAVYFTVKSREAPVAFILKKSAKRPQVSHKKDKGGLIGGTATVILLFIIGFIIVGCIFYRRKKKVVKEAAEKAGVSVTSTSVSVLPSAKPRSEWAPDIISATQFKFKGPLQLHPDQPLNLKHDLENVVVESPKPEEHIVFDDSLNEVHEIGSEVEIVVDAQGISSQGQNIPS